MSTTTPRIAQVPLSEIDDPDLQALLQRAEEVSAPKPAWYQTIAHNPELAKAWAAYWNATHHGGRVEHKLKELMRIAVAQLLACTFCAEQRSIPALEQGLTESEAATCALPDLEQHDPRTRAALRYVRALLLNDDPASFDPVYAELHAVFDEAEVVELALWAANVIGGIILTRSLRIEP